MLEHGLGVINMKTDSPTRVSAIIYAKNRGFFTVPVYVQLLTLSPYLEFVHRIYINLYILLFKKSIRRLIIRI
ncbi:hypothetical protein D3C86_2063750 [compost metagenome]